MKEKVWNVIEMNRVWIVIEKGGILFTKSCCNDLKYAIYSLCRYKSGRYFSCHQ